MFSKIFKTMICYFLLALLIKQATASDIGYLDIKKGYLSLKYEELSENAIKKISELVILREVSFKINDAVIKNYFTLQINEKANDSFIVKIPLKKKTFISIYRNGLKVKGDREIIDEIKPLLIKHWHSFSELNSSLKNLGYIRPYHKLSNDYLFFMAKGSDKEAKQTLLTRIIAGVYKAEAFAELIDIANLENLSKEEIFAFLYSKKNISLEISEKICCYLEEKAKSSDDPFIKFSLFYFYKAHWNTNKAISYIEKNPLSIAIAEWQLADLYLYKEDMEKALFWAKKAAEQGYAPALWFVGSGYENEGNMENALDLYKKAANEGLKEAIISLGIYFEKNKDYKEAFCWYKKAIEYGFKSEKWRIRSLKSKIQEEENLKNKKLKNQKISRINDNNDDFIDIHIEGNMKNISPSLLKAMQSSKKKFLNVLPHC